MKMRARVPLAAVLLSGLTVLPAGCGEDSSDGGTPPPPPSVVHVTENVTTPTSWTADHLYVIDSSIQVGATLTIAPGTIVKFAQGTGLTVATGGAILANGQSDATEIVFTSLKDDVYGGDTNGDGTATRGGRGDWSYVRVTASGSLFDHCTFKFGGSNSPYNGTLMLVNDSVVTVTNCLFANNLGGSPVDTRSAALHAGAAGAGTVLAGNTFTGNDLPLVVSGLYDVDGTNVFHGTTGFGNAFNGIFFYGPYQLVGDVTWSNTEVPYVILSALSVSAGSSLTLGDGVVVKIGPVGRIEVPGTLLADAANGITFTSLKDDVLGDTNGDGTGTVPAPGDWSYVSVTGSGSVFRRCLFSYGGKTAPYTGTLEIANGSAATIEDSVFAHNHGGTPGDNRAATLNLGAADGATIVTGNTFYDNDMPLVVNGLVSVDGTNVFHAVVGATTFTNAYNGIFMDGVEHAVIGTTTWSNTEVPYVVYNTVLGVGDGNPTPTGTLTLGDGVVVKLQLARIDLYLSGTILQGTGTYFTSFLDDSKLGDTNGDGASSGAAGDWQGVDICQGGPCSWATWGNILYAANP